MKTGSGEPTYKVLEGWLKAPAGWDLIEVPAVAVDSLDRVYVFCRGEHPMVVFDRDGNFLKSWGEGSFTRPHGIFIGPDEAVYCVDDEDHTVRKYTPDGKLLMTLGVSGQAADTGFVSGDFLSVKRGGPPFNFPTNVALSPEGEIYVTDGYGNARVHKFSAEGELLLSWGEPGSGPGQFRLVHGVCVDKEGTVYVGDRMNSRVQLFTPQGEFIAQWNDVYQPNDLYIDHEGYIFIPELGYSPSLPMPGPTPVEESSYPRVTIRDTKGHILAQIAQPDPSAPGGFLAPHGVRSDSRGDLYVSEVSATNARIKGLDRTRYHILQKFAHLS